MLRSTLNLTLSSLKDPLSDLAYAKLMQMLGTFFFLSTVLDTHQTC